MENRLTDIVVTWVDGSDEAWINERNTTCPEHPIVKRQYREWGLFKYWFRGIELYAPWVNNVYLITWGHLPEFLNVDHPKLKIINHEDYIPDEYLPTFNSNVIEMNMHRIEELSEQFLYFNDDMYLTQPTEITDFFENGLPKDVAILNPIAPANYNAIASTMLNNIGVINDHFDLKQVMKRDRKKWYTFKYGKLILLNMMFSPWKNAVGLYQQHLPSSMLKSTFDILWDKEYEVMHKTSSNRIRDVKVDINQWLVKEWQVMEGKFMPRNVNFGKYIMISKLEDVDKFNNALNNSKFKTLCLNDHVESNEDEIIDKVLEIFEKKFPNKSSYEL